MGVAPRLLIQVPYELVFMLVQPAAWPELATFAVAASPSTTAIRPVSSPS